MKINKKIAAFILIILVITWIGNIYYYKASQLKEPLFFNHYYDLEKGRNEFSLYYLSNISDDKSNNIVEVRFPEAANTQVPFNRSDWNSLKPYYKLNRLSIRIDNDYDYKIFKNKLITKAEITLSSGKKFIIPIGKIYIGDTTHGERVHKFYTGSFKSNSLSSNWYQTYEEIKINGVYCKFPELLQKTIKTDIDAKALNDSMFPLSYNSGETIFFKCQFIKTDYKTKNIVCEFPIYLQTQNTSGKIGYQPFYISNEPYDITRKTMLELLGERGKE